MSFVLHVTMVHWPPEAQTAMKKYNETIVTPFRVEKELTITPARGTSCLLLDLNDGMGLQRIAGQGAVGAHPAVGGVCPRLEHEAGNRLCEHMVAFDMFAVNTFAGGKNTYFGCRANPGSTTSAYRWACALP